MSLNTEQNVESGIKPEQSADQQSAGKKLSFRKKCGIAAGITAAVYVAAALFFQSHFLPRTVINGEKAGWRSMSAVEKEIQGTLENYSIVLKERSGRKETVSSEQVGLSYVDDGKLKTILKSQKEWQWLKNLFVPEKYDDGVTIQTDEQKFQETYDNLHALNENLTVKPVNAYNRYDEEEQQYVIAEEVYGNTVNDTFAEKLKAAMTSCSDTLDLEKEDCYQNPTVLKDSEEVVKANDTLNSWLTTDITYDFGDREENLNKEQICKWLYVNENYEPKVHKYMVAEYVKSLAKKYDTVGKKRTFTTAGGSEITVKGGTYGWKIDQEKETTALVKLIKKSTVEKKREPEYAHIAKSRKKNDIGNTYVEVDIGSQYMWFYKNGKLLVSTPVVTGDVTKGRGTPTGVYYIIYKTTNYTLTGQGYANKVKYWMPFTEYGVGLHDSSWRNGYGGGIYLGDGSHGCVNTPLSAVKKIYNNIESTYPVIVHN